MKITLMTMIALCFAGATFAQTLQVPQAAKDDFKARFPNASTAKWESSGKGFEAEWTTNGKETAVVYDAKGKFVMTEREIDLVSLPSVVTGGLRKAYPAGEAKEAEIQENANHTVTYQVEFKNNGKLMEVTFDAKGNPIARGAEGSGDDGSDGAEGSDGSDGSDED